MEFDTTRASFSFDAKPSGFKEDIRRSNIVDPGSHDLIVNALSQAAFTSRALAVPSDKQMSPQDVSYPRYITNRSCDSSTMLPLSTSSASNELSLRSHSPPNYEKVLWKSSATHDQLDQTPNGNWDSASTQAIMTPLQSLNTLSPESYEQGGFNMTSGSDATFSQCAAFIQPGFACTSKPSPRSNLALTLSVNDQLGITENGFYQFGLPNQAVSSADYFSIPNQQQLAPYHIDEQFFPSSSFGSPVGQSLNTGTGRISKIPDIEYELKIQPESTILDVCELQIPPPLPSQDEMMVNFSLRPEPPITKRSRKSYSKEGKRKVHAVRASGACTCCKARKLPCSPNGVCETCLKHVNNRSLAARICIRTKMKDDYIGVRDLHQSLPRRKANLEPLTSSLTGLPIHVQLCVKSELGIGGDIAQLDLEVMRCSSSPYCRWKRLERSSGILVTSDTTYDERYVIVPASIPSVDDFDNFGRQILLMQFSSHSGAITWYLDRFLSVYCSRPQPSSMRSLANLTSRIASLNNLVAYGFLNLHDGSFDLLSRPLGQLNQERYVSETIHDQVRVRVAEGLGPAERLMASELDKLMKIVGAGKHARIIAGICLLRLVLIYRDRLVRDEIRISLPNNKTHHQYRLDKAASFYRRLTASYWTLCREKDTPLTLEWEDEAGASAGERDAALEDAYLQLQPVFLQFCEERLCRQYDHDFQELIAKPLMTQHPRKKRRTAR
ncbi:hypothetical protein ONS95_013227 [Cadophora gregata]|uniref:uncharacterized protein n=1 Tax=Cadophora gregata TaxID=51156 RepID=UPI0026DB7BC0|nr:uncharacterized protein ONS95_013227 [Cadophora gregata]KAK0099951.1 hypothetical protein ONS96_007896 [Cadophora gregata f. sp. sojae]KAK0116197.1 hypothetical protein ONS95_013227 [Cadophora gregata]